MREQLTFDPVALRSSKLSLLRRPQRYCSNQIDEGRGIEKEQNVNVLQIRHGRTRTSAPPVCTARGSTLPPGAASFRT